MRRASVWTLAGYAGSQAVRLAGNLVLWRLLYPEAFGMMAIVNVFIQGLHMFSDVGVGPSIIQSPRGDDPRYLNTAWTIQALRGVALCVVAAATAGLAADFYEAPELASLIRVVALSTVIPGLNSTSLFTVKRRVQLGRLTLVELASQVAGLVTMIALAWVTRSIWSLVVGGVVSSVVMLVLSHGFLGGPRNKPVWDPESARALVHFGRWIFLSTLLTFAVVNSDRLIFGKLISLTELGVYSVATVWATLPRVIVERLCASVIFPLLSRAHNAADDFLGTFRRTRNVWLVIGGWMTACLVSGGPTLIRFLYDERASDAGWIIQFLVGGAWFAAIDAINQSAVMAQGRPKWMVASNAAKLFGIVVLIPLGYHLRGFPGAVGGLAASDICAYAITVVGLARSRIVLVGADVLLSAAVVGTCAAGLWAAGAVRQLLETSFALAPRLTAFLEGLATFVVVTAGWLIVWGFRSHRKRLLAREKTATPV